MRLSILLSLSIPIVLISCIGQQSSHTLDKSATTTVGDTVKDIGNNVMVVYHDRNSNLWFGSWESGLYRYDGKTIIHYTTKDGLSHNRIDEIKEDKLGNVYFNTRGEISRYDGQKITKVAKASSSNDAWRLEPDDLWFKGSQDSGCVYRYDGRYLHRLIFPATKEGDDYLAKLPNAEYSPYDVYVIYKDSRGNVWFGTGALGVCRYNGMAFTWLSEKELGFDIETDFGIRSIIEDSDGKFLFSNTLHRYDVYGQDNATDYVKNKGIGSLDGKKDGDLVAIMSMEKDNDDLWMVTYNQGVWRYSGKQITHYPVKNNDKDINLFSVYKDNNGHLWLGTHENGAYRFNGRTFEKFRP